MDRLKYWIENLVLLALALWAMSWTGSLVTGQGDGGDFWIVVSGMCGMALLALVPSTIAGRKGHDEFRWWVYGAALLPVAVVHAIWIEPTLEAADADADADGLVPCHFCAEYIRREAIVCRHCGRQVLEESTT